MKPACLLLSIALFGLLPACARSRSSPLPGDSVGSDGAVSLATPPLSTVGATPVAREPLSAIESRLYPPELIIENKALIALTSVQEEAITKELARSQTELVKLQFALQTAKDKLLQVLDDQQVDEIRSQKAADALMQRENAIKGAHLAQLVRIKNLLTPAQQDKLRAAREDARCRGADAGAQ